MVVIQTSGLVILQSERELTEFASADLKITEDTGEM